MKLAISHITHYKYAAPVADSVNEIRLTPRTNDRQSCYQQSITIEPNASLFSYEDFFGNRVHVFSVNDPHGELTIRTDMTVVTKEAPIDAPVNQGEPEKGWSWLRSEEAINRYAEFLVPTAYTSMTEEVKAFAAEVMDGEDGKRLSVLSWLKALSERIRIHFIYDPSATNVNTTTSEIFEHRRGVCQDFAHLMIACSKSVGIPARYVSGYHFVGDLQGGSTNFEQASHAWVEAYVPSLGWYCFDPTNADPVGDRYVKLAHGRDYKDIVPVKGVYRGNGEQQLTVTVDVREVVEST